MNYINILGFYGFRTEGIFLNGLMNFCFGLDRAIYFILEKVYILFWYLCNLNLPTLSNLFTNLIDRIFALVGVVLLFALALKILDAIVNPDGSFIKNSKQFGITLFTTVAILMLTMPVSGNRGIIFRYLDEIEDVFLPAKDDEGLIMRILFGGGSNQSTNISDEVYGRQMAKSILMQFIVIDSNAGNNVKYVYNDIKNCNSDKECNYGDLGDILNKKEVAYYPGVSGLAGIYMIYILFHFSLTAVRRCFELLVLEVLAPVFVLFRLDDKSKNIWNSFVSRYKDVYIKLFVLTFSFYFGIMLINNVLVYASQNIWGDAGSVAYETTNSAASSLLAMNVSAAGIDAPKGFAGVLFTIVLIVGILGFVSSMPDVICGLLGVKSDENVRSFGSFLGSAAGTIFGGALSLGGAALGFGLDKATGGKFGDLVVDKGRKIKDSFAKTSFTGGIERRYNKRKQDIADAELKAERENIQKIYNSLSQNTSQTAATNTESATGTATTGATSSKSTMTMDKNKNSYAKDDEMRNSNIGSMGPGLNQYEAARNSGATNSETNSAFLNISNDEIDKINKINAEADAYLNSVNNNSSNVINNTSVKNETATNKPKREMPTGSSRPEMPHGNANASRPRVGEATMIPGVRRVELPDDIPTSLKYGDENFANLVDLKKQIDEGNADLEIREKYSDLRKQYKPLTESEYNTMQTVQVDSSDVSLSQEERDRLDREYEEYQRRLYANNGFIEEDVLSNESRNIEDVVKKSNNSIRNQLDDALKAEGTNPNNYYKDHEEFSKAENIGPNLAQDFDKQQNIRDFYNNNGDIN